MINTSKAYQDYVVFVDSKALRGRSKAEYLRQVRKLDARHPERSLKQISERMLFDHLIYLRDKERLRPSTLNQAVVALRMFYRDYLQRDCKLWEQFEIRRDQPLPVVLTRDEVHQLLGAVRENRFKAMLALIYHCGLRVGEAVRLRPKDIDSKRGILRVIDGKGGKNREVPIAPQMIERPRAYWCFHRNAHWLFPGVGRGWKERSRTLQAHGGWHRADECLQCPGGAARGGAQRAGRGRTALRYLASYVKKSALSEGRLLGYDQSGRIVLSYRDSADGKLKNEALDPLELIGRWLLHVLPKGLVRVRHYGWLSPAAHKAFLRVRFLLGLGPYRIPAVPKSEPPRCPFCNRLLSQIARIAPQRAPPCARRSSRSPYETDSINTFCSRLPHAEQNPLPLHLPNNSRLWLEARACHPKSLSHCHESQKLGVRRLRVGPPRRLPRFQPPVPATLIRQAA